MAIRFASDTQTAPSQKEQLRAANKAMSAVVKHTAEGTMKAPKQKSGRKPDPNAKKLLTLRLDPQVIEYFRSTGEGWQTRMNEALRKAAGL
jgi:uncharacterized protein (DUF4415 family)